MSDTQSIADSTVSKQSNRNKMKICAYCGKQENSNWSRHFQTQHKGLDQKEWKQWVPGSRLLGDPWCENWQDVISKGAKPINVLPQQQRGNRRTSSVCSRSNIGNDAEEEEQKKEELKENNDFGALAGNSAILGKRSSPEDQQQLEGAVNEELQQEQSALFNTDSTDSPNPKPVVAVGSIKRSNTQQKNNAECTKLSVQNLNTLSQATMKQKQQETPQEFQQEFKKPLPVTIYRKQQDWAQDVIQQLKELNEKEEKIPTFDDETGILELCRYFTQPIVSSYLKQNREHLSFLKTLLILTQQRCSMLSIEENTSIAYASILMGDSAWVSLPRMFASLADNDANKLKDILYSLRGFLADEFNENLAEWICSHWRYLEEQTLTLLRRLKEKQYEIEGTLATDIVTFSLLVSLPDVSKYCNSLRVFSRFPAFNLMLKTFEASIGPFHQIQKLTYDEFSVLASELMQTKNQQLIRAKEEQLVKYPLSDWHEKVKSFQKDLLIQNSGSVQARLNYLGEKYGHLSNKDHRVNLYCNDKRYKRIMHEVVNPPNELQFANAQYASFALSKCSKQLWCIPSGQGKSRVLATMALILLLTEATSKVHLVFDSYHLMQRDQNDFAQWWKLASLEANIEYHVGIDDLECQLGEIILIDEADELIFNDPVKFIQKTQQFKCICLTATPDNADTEGVEREVIQMLGFSLFNGQNVINNQPLNNNNKEKLMVNETMDFKTDIELISFIEKEVKTRPVLLYCSSQFEEVLVASSIPLLSMKDGKNDIDNTFLRSLDSTSNQKGTYPLIVCSSSFGMRGFDYRAPILGITLILASSFPNERHKMQGLDRVGRFDDPYRRIQKAGTALIDEKQRTEYVAKLQRLLAEYVPGKKVGLNLPLKKEEKKKTTDTSSLTVVQCKTKRRSQIVGANKTATAVGKEERREKKQYD